MKKNIGTLILIIGVLVIVSSVVLTPAATFNPADSSAGTKAAAAIFFGGVAISGVGIVLLANSLPNYGEKAREKRA